MNTQRSDFLGVRSATIQWSDGPLPKLVPDTISASPPPTGNLFEPGQVVEGKYEIRKLLGAGGMGQVYEAATAGSIASSPSRRPGPQWAPSRCGARRKCWRRSASRRW